MRNSKAIELLKFFKKKNKVDVFDPVVNKKALNKFHSIKTINRLKKNNYNIIIIAVPHKKIKNFSIKYLRSLGNKNSIIIDIKSIFPKKTKNAVLRAEIFLQKYFLILMLSFFLFVISI